MRVLKGTVRFALILACAWFLEVARFNWDDWASVIVQRTHEPLEITLVNGTPANIPVLDVGIAGWVCQATCLVPGKEMHCRPEFGSASNVFIQIGLTGEEAFPHVIKAPVEQVPVAVTWRSYGSIELALTDAGVIVNRFPDEFAPW
ncbi:MAG: hypothetical protein JNM17_18635 [Archangium sp.]|nr:hypothetical protein [Archangium sp.]